MRNRVRILSATLAGSVLIIGGQTLVQPTYAFGSGQPALCSKRPAPTAIGFGPDLVTDLRHKNSLTMKSGSTCLIFTDRLELYRGSTRVWVSRRGDRLRLGANIVVIKAGKTQWKSGTYRKGVKRYQLNIWPSDKSLGKLSGKISINKGGASSYKPYWVRP